MFSLLKYFHLYRGDYQTPRPQSRHRRLLPPCCHLQTILEVQIILRHEEYYLHLCPRRSADKSSRLQEIDELKRGGIQRGLPVADVDLVGQHCLALFIRGFPLFAHAAAIPLSPTCSYFPRGKGCKSSDSLSNKFAWPVNDSQTTTSLPDLFCFETHLYNRETYRPC